VPQIPPEGNGRRPDDGVAEAMTDLTENGLTVLRARYWGSKSTATGSKKD
jgi:hypothetical protein